jgi:hypothetical protein
MAKPFVVMLPEADRESLRNSGVIPPGAFRSFDTESVGWDDNMAAGAGASSIYLWPFDLNYADSDKLLADVERNPVDIAAFFGLAASSDDAEMRRNERLIAKLLDAVCVHVVFLDKKRAGSGYAAFGSFSEIAKWSRNLRKALGIRFPNAPVLNENRNVLVIVARGQQVKASKEELAEFSRCVGTDPDCTFRSCYYMDFNLRRGQGGGIIHSHDIWDVMTARLLLAFMLSREETPANANAQATFWENPGIKVWRSQECHVGVDPSSRTDFLDEAFGYVGANLRNAARDADMEKLALFCDDAGSEVSLEGLDHLEVEEKDPEWRSVEMKSWCDFSASRCASHTIDAEGSRWKPRFAELRRAFGRWCVGRRRTERDPDPGDVFEGVKNSPKVIFEGTSRLEDVLIASRDRMSGSLKGEGALNSGWSRVFAAERRRLGKLSELAADGEEFDRARRHYVGWLPGIIVFIAVSVMFGWVLHRIVVGLGGALSTSLALAGSAALGAFAAVALILHLHGNAGRRGARAIAEESREADKLMVARDNCVRDMVSKAMGVRRQLLMRALRFRVSVLLKRVESILSKEISARSATAILCDDEDDDVAESTHEDDFKKGFIRTTNRQIGRFRPDDGPATRAAIEQCVNDWWSMTCERRPANPPDNFGHLWAKLASKDSETAGYFPAKLFVREIRDFVARFTDKLRNMEERLVIRDNAAALRDGLRQWFDEIVSCDDPYLWATGEISGATITEGMVSSPRIYLQPDPALVDLDEFEQEAMAHATALAHFRPVSSALIGRLPQLGFMFQEYPVSLSSDANGNLVFGEVGDAI